MAPTEEWKEMARYLEDQSKQVAELQATLNASSNANQTGVPLDFVDRTELDQAEDWVDSRIDDDTFDGEDEPSRMIRSMELYKVVREETGDDVEDEGDLVPDDQPGEEDSDGGDEREKKSGRKSSKQSDDDDSDWGFSSGDSDDSSDAPSRRPSAQVSLSANAGQAPGSGRGNRSKEAHTAPEYTVAEKKKVIMLYGKWFGRRNPPSGFLSKLRRAFNKWLRQQRIMMPGDQSKPLKRHKGGIRQQSKKLWADGWRRVDGRPVPPAPKEQLVNTTIQNNPATSSEPQQPGGTSGGIYAPIPAVPSNSRPAEAPVTRPRPSYETDPTSRLRPPPSINPSHRPAQAQATNSSASQLPPPSPAVPPPSPPAANPGAADVPARLPTPPGVPPPGPEREEWLAMRRRGEEDLRQRRLNGPIARMLARNRKADHDRRYGFHHPGCGCGRP
ncbi:hypothetical protein LTR85_011273 [Meristemomyces frigidus]|nr:hypothetical protein LTR85_011273 [Meristemomyces frigidus]